LRAVTFVVPGIAASQGSKTVVPTKAGPRVRESNEQRLKPWRMSVAATAHDEMGNAPLFTGGVQLDVTFVFPRPGGHFGTGRNAGSVKASAPEHMTVRPDLSKLVRAVEDSLTGVVYRDDSQVVGIRARKTYGEPASARISIWEVL